MSEQSKPTERGEITLDIENIISVSCAGNINEVVSKLKTELEKTIGYNRFYAAISIIPAYHRQKSG